MFMFISAVFAAPLTAGSPAIDAGDNTAVPTGITPAHTGVPRFVGDAADLAPPIGVPDHADIHLFVTAFQAGRP